MKKAMCQKKVLLFGTLRWCRGEGISSYYQNQNDTIILNHFWYNTDKTHTPHCSVPKNNSALSIPFSLPPKNGLFYAQQTFCNGFSITVLPSVSGSQGDKKQGYLLLYIQRLHSRKMSTLWNSGVLKNSRLSSYDSRRFLPWVNTTWVVFWHWSHGKERA